MHFFLHQFWCQWIRAENKPVFSWIVIPKIASRFTQHNCLPALPELASTLRPDDSVTRLGCRSGVFVRTGGRGSSRHSSQSGCREGFTLAEDGCLQPGKTVAQAGRPAGERSAPAGGESCLFALSRQSHCWGTNKKKIYANFHSNILPLYK